MLTRLSAIFSVHLLLALAAGAVFPFALAPYGWWAIAVVSPAILYALLYRANTAWQAFWLGECYGIGLWCVGAFWLYTSIHVYGNTPSWLALLMIGVVGVGMGLFHAGMSWLFWRFFTHQPLSFAALWVLQEWLKTWVFTGFPWLFVGYAVTEVSWLTSYAPVLGVFAISFVLVFVATALVELARRRYYWMLPSILLVLLGVGLTYAQWTQSDRHAPLSVSLVQGNIPQDLKWLTEYREKTLSIYAQLSRSEWGRDVVVWPESSIPLFQTEAMPFIMAVAQFARESGSSWLTGVPYQDVESYDPDNHRYPPFYNSVIALGKDASGIYKKQNLVPFGEYVPFEGALDWVLPDLAKSQDILSFSAGEENQSPLQLRGQQMGVAVCYEVAYPDTTRRNAANSHFLMTVSNDAWFGKSAGPLQHLQMVQMRAIETGRWFIRATNTGVTAIIDHQGRIVKQAPQFERTVLRGELQGRVGQTPFVRFGNLPILGLIGLILLFSGYRRHQVRTG